MPFFIYIFARQTLPPITRPVATGTQTPIDASTRYCAVLGHPIAHSASPVMHNAALSALGLNWRYLAFDVRPEQLPAALLGAKQMHFLGLNLTVPHKILAVPLMDIVDSTAQEWGAVNTVRFEGFGSDGTWIPLHNFGSDPPEQVRAHGFNTDADALLKSLEEDLGFHPRQQRVLLLGAGGAGRVAALKLAAAGVAELYLVNRSQAKAEEVERIIRERFPEVRIRMEYPTGPVDLVLNATSLGLKGEQSLDSSFSLRGVRAVYDMVYRPARTPLLEAASAAGCRVANGLGMLLHQGAAALELWSGQVAPVRVMQQALRAHIYGQHL